MIVNPDNCTMYVWCNGQDFNLEEFHSMLGGLSRENTPSWSEIAFAGIGKAMFTDKHILYHNQRGVEKFMAGEFREFSTNELRERMISLGMEVPDWELPISYRDCRVISNPPQEIVSVAQILDNKGMSVLLTPGTDLEGEFMEPFYCSERLSNKPQTQLNSKEDL